MTYSEKAMREIEHDPDRLRAYLWRMTMHWRRLAREYRDNSRRGHADGHDLLRMAVNFERLAALVGDNIDSVVEFAFAEPPDEEIQADAPMSNFGAHLK